jgi:hypothetical protein
MSVGLSAPFLNLASNGSGSFVKVAIEQKIVCETQSLSPQLVLPQAFRILISFICQIENV